MNLRKITTRAVVAGATTALAAGAFVGVTSTAANAVIVSNTYTCTLTGIYSGDFAMTVSGELPVPQYYAGASVPAGIISIEVSATVPADAAALLGAYDVTGAKSDDYALTLGSGAVPIPIAGDFVAADGATTWEATGANTAFVTGNPGTVDGFLPEAFTLLPTKADGTTFGSLACALKDATPAEIVTDFPLQKRSSQTVAKNVTVKKGKAAVVPVTVSSTTLAGLNGGKVVAKEGKKTLGTAKVNSKGKASLNLGKTLKVGKHKITLTYSGIPSMGGSTGKVTVTVKK